MGVKRENDAVSAWQLGTSSCDGCCKNRLDWPHLLLQLHYVTFLLALSALDVHSYNTHLYVLLHNPFPYFASAYPLGIPLKAVASRKPVLPACTPREGLEGSMCPPVAPTMSRAPDLWKRGTLAIMKDCLRLWAKVLEGRNRVYMFRPVSPMPGAQGRLRKYLLNVVNE